MGTSTSAAQLSSKLARFGEVGIPEAQAKGLQKAAASAKRELEVAGTAAGALGSWRNMKGKGGKSFVSAIVRADGASISVHGAPAYITNEGAPKHLILPKKSSRRGKIRKKGPTKAQAAAIFGAMAGGGGMGATVNKGVMAVPGYGDKGRGFSRTVHHPGVKAKRWFRGPATVIEKQTPRIMQAELGVELAKTFK